MNKTDYSGISMRDAFFDRVYEFAKEDRDITIISADMGAPALDKFRRDFRDRFYNIGIAEQNMISVASGMASEGKKVFTFAIAPFITSRCYEFTKLNAGLMKFPIFLVGCGTGFGYDDSGPTHHTTEDISIMRAIPNLDIWSPSDSISARTSAELVYLNNNPAYIRLDREGLPQIHDSPFNGDGYLLFPGAANPPSIAIIATGNMVHNALKIQQILEKEGKSLDVIELYKLKKVSSELPVELSQYKQLVSVEEHLLDGGLGSIVSEIITDNGLDTKLRRIGLEDYVYAYGGRENIQRICEIDNQSVINQIKGIIK